MLTVLLGGARSGKSTLAERLGRSYDETGRDVAYIATSPHIPGDDDLDGRIRTHRSSRPGHWRTIEEELALTEAIDDAGSALVIVDCLTVWVNNLLHHGETDDTIAAASDAALAAAAHRTTVGLGDTIVISNEIGLGIVPEHAISRRYRDLLGRINQAWVRMADRAYFVVAGKALPLHDLDDIAP